MPRTPVLPEYSAFTPVLLETFRWPGGIDQGLVVLHAEPDELAARYGVEFARDLDDLDWHQVAVVRLRSGRLVKFYRYERSPHPGTTVTIDRNDSLDAAWAELRAALGVDDSATNWRSEFMRGAAPAP
ncbi:hypothetical protein tb265_31900 [Gemmatimonadetes bacterium T265]|nr:hypothetical protein tb265_31900 [Gemmatimonadetes bacterium T265]